jgi:hypothetical protein
MTLANLAQKEMPASTGGHAKRSAAKPCYWSRTGGPGSGTRPGAARPPITGRLLLAGAGGATNEPLGAVVPGLRTARPAGAGNEARGGALRAAPAFAGSPGARYRASPERARSSATRQRPPAAAGGPAGVPE